MALYPPPTRHSSDIHALVDDERLLTAEALGTGRRIPGAEGRLLDCAELLVVALCDAAEGHHLRPAHPCPEWILASVSCAKCQNPVAGSAVRRPGHGIGVAVRPTTFSSPAACPPTPNRWPSCAWGRCRFRTGRAGTGWLGLRGHCDSRLRKPMGYPSALAGSPSRRIGHADREIDVFGRHVKGQRSRGKRPASPIVARSAAAGRWELRSTSATSRSSYPDPSARFRRSRHRPARPSARRPGRLASAPSTGFPAPAVR